MKVVPKQSCAASYALSLLLICLLAAISDAETCDPHDKDILLKIKSHFKNIDPFSPWDPKTDCCGWGSIGCGSSGRVTSLFVRQILDPVSTSFTIPPIIGDLSMLETLVMENIPGLMGPIPESIFKLTNLHQLYIGTANLSGPLPDFSGMTSLYRLGLPHNRFSGNIPASLALLPNLDSIELDYNMLSGPIPESFGLFKNKMTLWLNGNKELSGVIPKSLGNVNFFTLDLSDNKFEGDASFLLGKDKHIEELGLSDNQLQFDFSNVELPLGIKVFDISNNKIHGSLNSQLGQLQQLISFAVSDNQLCGKVPQGGPFRKFGPDSYARNKCLCDAPGLPPCKSSSN
ncbi:hypothetical protein vseg_021737 [Gypsophila vaccaria]